MDAHSDFLMHTKPQHKAKGRSFELGTEGASPSELAAVEVVRGSYRLPDLRKGDPGADNPLDGFAWPELRDLIYDRPCQR